MLGEDEVVGWSSNLDPGQWAGFWSM